MFLESPPTPPDFGLHSYTIEAKISLRNVFIDTYLAEYTL